MIDTSIEPILGNQVYAPKKVGDWTSSIVEAVLKMLQAANKPFKYVVTCIIMQKNGAGLHTASTCFWDTKSDGRTKQSNAQAGSKAQLGGTLAAGRACRHSSFSPPRHPPQQFPSTCRSALHHQRAGQRPAERELSSSGGSSACDC